MATSYLFTEIVFFLLGIIGIRKEQINTARGKNAGLHIITAGG